MTIRNLALAGQKRRGSSVPGALYVAILDVDSGFLEVLANRMKAASWKHRVLASPVPPDEIVAMRLSALVLDLAVLSPYGWSYLEKLSEGLPQLGVVVCTGPSSVAQRVRGLRLGADDWLSKPCHPEELIARVETVVRRRRRADLRGVLVKTYDADGNPIEAPFHLIVAC